MAGQASISRSLAELWIGFVFDDGWRVAFSLGDAAAERHWASSSVSAGVLLEIRNVGRCYAQGDARG